MVRIAAAVITPPPSSLLLLPPQDGKLAPEAAGVIHSDIERGFICAEVQTFEDLKELVRREEE